MTDADRAEFAALLSDVLGFYGKPTTEFAMSVWWQACAPFDISAVRKAMTAHATDPDRGHFAPMPADVIRNIRGTSKESAHMAWQRLIEQIRTVGSYGRPKLDAPTSAALESIGGWSGLCQSQESQLSWLQRQFLTAYGVQTERMNREGLAQISGHPVPRMEAIPHFTEVDDEEQSA